MTENFSRWDAADYLESEENIALYLEACMEEDRGDGALIRAALLDIARARNMSELAREVGVSREGLRKALSEKGNPSFSLILKIAHALNLDIRLTPAHAAHHGVDNPSVPNEVVGMVIEREMTPMKAWREHLGLTQADVAGRMGISQAALAQMENSQEPRRSTRVKFARSVGISPEQLDF